MVGTIVVMLMVTSLNAQARAAVKVELQQQGIVAMNRIIKDLQTSIPAGVSLRKATPGQVNEPEVLSIHPIATVSSSDPPAQIFSRQLIVYSWAPTTDRIWRQEFPPDPNNPPMSPPGPTAFRALRLNQADLLSLGRNLPPAARQVGADITAFNVTTPAAAPMIGTPLTLTVSLEKLVRDRTYKFFLTRTVSLRNSD